MFFSAFLQILFSDYTFNKNLCHKILRWEEKEVLVKEECVKGAKSFFILGNQKIISSRARESILFLVEAYNRGRGDTWKTGPSLLQTGNHCIVLSAFAFSTS